MTVTTGAYHSGADWPEVEAVPGVHRRVLSCGDDVMVVQFRIAAGAAVPAHTHPLKNVRNHFEILYPGIFDTDRSTRHRRSTDKTDHF